MNDENDTIFIRSQRSTDNTTYIATLEVGPDSSFLLDRESAVRYAQTLNEACERAEYDAAVYSQMIKQLKMDAEEAQSLMLLIRENRKPLDCTGLPLEFDPGLTAQGKPFIIVLEDGKQTGQFEIEDAYLHASHILRAPLVAELDANYYDTLVNIIGTEPNVARSSIGNLMEHR